MNFKSKHSSIPTFLILFALSVSFHMTVFFLLEITLKLQSSPNLVELNLLSPEEVQQMRTVGIREGKKDGIYLSPERAKRAPRTKPTPPSPSPSKEIQATNDLNLQEIGTEQGIFFKKQEKRADSNSFNSQTSKDWNEVASPQLPSSIPMIPSTDFNVHFEIPKGVSEDELNKAELVFYGYRRRMAESYLNSLLQTYKDFVMSHPYFRLPRSSRQEILTGRLTFDKFGNVKTIKVIRWSEDDLTQKFFQQVLETIDSVPNPPRAFTKHQDEFNVYYNLIING